MTPTPRPPETDAERRTRQLDRLRDTADLAFRVAQHAASKILADAPGPPDPGPLFNHAVREVRQTIALEAKLAAPEKPAAKSASASPPRPMPGPRPPPDPRRAPIRQALHQVADTEPDRAERKALKQDIDQLLDHELTQDPEAQIPVPEILASVADQLGLRLDLSRLPDHLIGLAPLPTPNTPRYHPRE